MQKRIAVIGSGWRAETWVHVVNALHGYSVSAVFVRNGEKAEKFRRLGVPVSREIPDADIHLVCVSKTENYAVCERLLKEGAAVLCETPAGMSAEECAAFSALSGKLQFAEQYPLQPRFRALQALAESGVLGEIQTVSLSCCHGYHAVSLFRRLLGTGREIPDIQATTVSDGYFETAGREGDFSPRYLEHARTLAILRFCGKTGIYDFSKAQYFSTLRHGHVLLQGTRGEVLDGSGYRLSDTGTAPFRLEARYGGTEGRLDAPEIIDIVCEGKVLYENPFRGLRLSGEEIAMADCLCRTADYFDGGDSCYSASEAAFDASLALKLNI